MIASSKIRIKSEKGIHARVAAMVICKADELKRKYNVNLFITKEGCSKIALSSLMVLIGMKIKKGDFVLVEAKGMGAGEALHELCEFLKGEFSSLDEQQKLDADEIINENALTLEQIINATSHGIAAIDENEKVMLFNDSAQSILNIKSEDIMGREIGEVLPQCKLPLLKNIKQKENGKKIKIGETHIIANRTPILIEGRFKGAVATFEDISNIEKVTEELVTVKALKEKQQLILESVGDGICVLDSEGTITYVNKSYSRITGVSKEDLEGKHITEISPIGSRSRALALGERITGTISIKDNGTTVISDVSPIVVEGEIHGVVSVVKDVSEIEKLYKKLNEVSHKAEYLQEELIRTKRSFKGFHKFKGTSGKTIDVLALAAKASKVGSTVLIKGESGTGKELIAEGIHYQGDRAKNPFIRVNCAAIPESLIESELFGYEKGAFTGAIKRKYGKFELAHKGTIFLDEIGELSSKVQAKILRVIQRKEFQRVGGEETVKVDVRIISATHRNLEDMVAVGEFREDLYYRLNVIPILIPPLRERREDIPLLAEYFIRSFEGIRHVQEIDSEALNILVNYDWPGNVRELENIIERSMALLDGDVIHKRDLPMYLNKGEHKSRKRNNEPKVTELFIEEETDSGDILPMSHYEKIIIEKALKKYGSFNAAGKALGITHKTVASKARKYGIEKKVRWNIE